ncbi:MULTISPECIES: succinate--CoA ligase subunit alpha [Pseudothermotoga]|jgi:succinyl-CoA synthetase alpha subunit|uniref:CoA-binding domain protein n=1 Tax=Pseudothermotoga lettingae (strain ATCC BAA-301 / DSM 14385 / NBRC 107922 / TMO) TaxID=416591 RepID=A8F784_PSELT|nr:MULTISPECIES: CoA-binding protein [Pseudothermotoga]ABV34018.1 CoA-binding domain protein [Pseudothermotoga lettingae TMO]MDI3494856.1 succinyl-CoA synthetase alpha subunit [Pseudothermotoga sp.]MDK2884644.1 succinyl-CoA synthetase alpha subunit [Pseudothermotoga sp.]GLI49043.1 succinyl-CoA synthetase subunit alpha [Pseudothermotoga lettingae TMO]HBJ81217.1 CoA-binding protein [Pseudothermotoga sp.]
MFCKSDRVCVYGITGKYGSHHTIKMKNYGTNIICGVSKRKITEFEGIPVYKTLKEAKENPDTAIIFVPKEEVLNAFLDAVENSIKKIVIISEHVPIHDALKITKISKKLGIKVVGPNCPGVIVPGEVKVGIMPEKYFKPGEFALISRSGTLMYEIARIISKADGIKIAMGLGGDPVVGTNVAEAFDEIENMSIRKVMVIGEIGGNDEVNGIKYAREKGFDGEIFSFFAGRYAPEGVRMGHAGAIIEGESGRVQYKEEKLRQYDVKTIRNLFELEKIFN